MKRRLHVDRPAELEVEEASDWYEQREAGLGAAFVAAFHATLSRIVESPEAFTPVHGVDLASPVRSARVKRFPFRVIFLEERECLRVLAVMHDRQRPGYWRDRLAPDSS